MTGKGYILHVILTCSPSGAFYGAFMEIMSELYHRFTLVGLGGVFKNPPAGGRVESMQGSEGRGGRFQETQPPRCHPTVRPCAAQPSAAETSCGLWQRIRAGGEF